ncbi:hypothetical protein M885DRAFT_507069 [Pelagophyceae sp. CCMP2097]|nr:hypothetical protein M885DRAFT_507069 [Pelagophyceae sp. CCMP2097]
MAAVLPPARDLEPAPAVVRRASDLERLTDAMCEVAVSEAAASVALAASWSAFTLPSAAAVSVVLPGVVLIRGALDMEQQLWVTRAACDVGHARGRWWGDDGLLNNHRQGRGRVYDSLGAFGDHRAGLEAVCAAVVSAAECAGGVPPGSEAHTHLLAILFERDRELGWHRDDGANDGVSIAPVVSISVGNTAIFDVKPDAVLDHESGGIVAVQLESGDALVFGGVARHIRHRVRTVVAGTAPTEVAQAYRSLRPDHDDFDGFFRCNLTFRHAPELAGREAEPNFIFLAKSQRSFAASVQELGVDEARKRANAKRAEKHHKKDDS